MKQQITIPVRVLFSIAMAAFMLGIIFGGVTSGLLISRPVHQSSETEENVYKKEKVFVSQVVDGDTIVVKMENQEVYVSYLGIDTPDEKDGIPTYFAKEAAEKNRQLVEGKNVLLIWNPKRRTSYRLVGYVFIDDIFVNAELLRDGYASIFRGAPKSKTTEHIYEEIFNQFEQEARASQKGIWNFQEKSKWEQLNIPSKPREYIADAQYFHRPECPKVKEIQTKVYYYIRENALRNNKQPCPLCKP